MRREMKVMDEASDFLETSQVPGCFEKRWQDQ
jgi:hypothetical protein